MVAWISPAHRASAVRLAGFVSLLFLLPPLARAMTVLPPTFSELVDESARIVRGRVMQVEAFRATTPDGHSVIKTRVTWQVQRTLKGADAGTLTLEFLGGRMGTDSLTVPGMPAFAVGNDDYLFVERDVHVLCPLIAAGHGRYGVKTDATGRAYVARENGLPLTDVAQVAEPLTAATAALAAKRTPAQAYTPEAFEAEVLATLHGTTAASRNE
jgi:hypothetical protein